MTQNKYWSNNPEAYEKHKKNMREYFKTEQGQLVHKKANEKFKNKNPDYLKIYMKNRRIECKQKGICTRCFKRETREKFTTCQYCYETAKKRFKEKTKEKGNEQKKKSNKKV